MESDSQIASNEKIIDKLIEEVKIFWTIQTAVGAVLGYLGTNLSFAFELPSSPQAASCISSAAAKDTAICIVALMPVIVGGLYNIVANYYIRLDGVRANLASGQEIITTLVLALMYLLFSISLGAVGGHAADRVDGSASLCGALLGAGFSFALVYSVCGFTHASLFYVNSGYTEAYQEYSRPLEKMFLPAHWVYRSFRRA